MKKRPARHAHTHNHASRMFMWPIQGTGIASYTHIAAQKKDIGSLLHNTHLSLLSLILAASVYFDGVKVPLRCDFPKN